MERSDYYLIKQELNTDYHNYLSKQRGECKAGVIENEISENESILYFKVNGISREVCNDEYKTVFSAIALLNIPVINVVNICNGVLSIYFGTKASYVDALKGFISQKLAMNISGEFCDNELVFNHKYRYSSVLVGECAAKPPESAVSVLDDLIRSGSFHNISVVITGIPADITKLVNNYYEVFTKARAMLEQLLSRQITIRDERESISYNDVEASIVNLKNAVDESVEKYESGISQGMFNCTLKVYSDYSEEMLQVSGNYMSFFSDGSSIVPLNMKEIKGIEYNAKPIVTLTGIKIGDVRFKQPLYSNFYTSEIVSQLMRCPTLDSVGYEKRIIPHFDVARDICTGLHIGKIMRENSELNEYYVPMEDLNRHIFVPGMTGSGKTNTVKYILYKLNAMKIPWMVIEPAKAEYYDIYKLGIGELRILSVNTEGSNLYINPFQPINENVQIQEHIDCLFAAFMASFTWVSPLPFVLENALYKIYEVYGFDLHDVSKNQNLQYPTIEALYWIIPIVVDEMGYEGRMSKEITASLQSRISTMRRGTKGDILNVSKSVDFETLFTKPTIIELENIKDNSTKTFVMSLICILLREYSMQQKDQQLSIRHYMLVEEAHRLLKKTVNPNSECIEGNVNGVDFFSEMLAELRSKGQGFILADQIPEHLVEDVLKNTNLKITHRLVSRSDATLVGDSMNCSEEQIRYMAALSRGEAMIYSEGDISPKIVKVPYVNDFYLAELVDLCREEILKKCAYYCDESANMYNQNPFKVIFNESYDGVELTDDLIDEVEFYGEKLTMTCRKDEITACLEELKEFLKNKEKSELLKVVVNRIFLNCGFSLDEFYENIIENMCVIKDE